jgi:hypothetical protein
VSQREIKPSVSATQTMGILVINAIAVIWCSLCNGAVTAIFFCILVREKEAERGRGREKRP